MSRGTGECIEVKAHTFCTDFKTFETVFSGARHRQFQFLFPDSKRAEEFYQNVCNDPVLSRISGLKAHKPEELIFAMVPLNFDPRLTSYQQKKDKLREIAQRFDNKCFRVVRTGTRLDV